MSDDLCYRTPWRCDAALRPGGGPTSPAGWPARTSASGRGRVTSRGRTRPPQQLPNKEWSITSCHRVRTEPTQHLYDLSSSQSLSPEGWKKYIKDWAYNTQNSKIFCFSNYLESLARERNISTLIFGKWTLINLRWRLIAVFRSSAPIVWIGWLFTNLFKTVTLEHQSNPEKIYKLFPGTSPQNIN